MVYTDRVCVSADSEAELHYFAGQVGLDRLCFSGGGAYAHYMLNGADQARKAIEGGAEVMERSEFCEKCGARFTRV